jgi:prepilin-type N-terminal cleavage/methylation domain-containing protein
MRRNKEGPRGGMYSGFTLVEMLIVMAIIFIIASIAIPLLRAALLRSHISAAAADAKVLHSAFKRHFVDMNAYPNAEDAPAFDLASFEPLVRLGYYQGRMFGRLLDDKADAYDSPDDRGLNQEFWLEMTLRYDPSIRFLIADSDNAPLGGGDYYDGVYLFRDGVLTSITAVKE